MINQSRITRMDYNSNHDIGYHCDYYNNTGKLVSGFYARVSTDLIPESSAIEWQWLHSYLSPEIHNPCWAWITSFGTHHDHKQKGYGRKILRAFQRRLIRDFPHNHILVGLAATTEGAFLYDSCDFKFLYADPDGIRLQKLRTMKHNVKSGLWSMLGYGVKDENGQPIRWDNNPHHYCYGVQYDSSKMYWEHRP